VSIAGSFALDLENLTTTAQTLGSVTLSGTTPDATLNAVSNSSSTVKAEPIGAGAGGGSSFGFGASVALNLINDTTTAAIGNGATISGGRNLSLSATSTDLATT
jgi:hypothetical protein